MTPPHIWHGPAPVSRSTFDSAPRPALMWLRPLLGHAPGAAPAKPSGPEPCCLALLGRGGGGRGGGIGGCGFIRTGEVWVAVWRSPAAFQPRGPGAGRAGRLTDPAGPAVTVSRVLLPGKGAAFCLPNRRTEQGLGCAPAAKAVTATARPRGPQGDGEGGRGASGSWSGCREKGEGPRGFGTCVFPFAPFSRATPPNPPVLFPPFFPGVVGGWVVWGSCFRTCTPLLA